MPQQRNQYIIALFIQKNIVQKIGFCVTVTGCLPDGSGVFVSDQIQNKVVFALRELEQASVWLHKELHFLQLGERFQRSILNRGSQTLGLFKINLFAVAFLCDLGQSYHSLYRICFVADHKIPGFCIEEILEDPALVSVVIVQRIGLFFADPQTGITPNLRIGSQPPVVA